MLDTKYFANQLSVCFIGNSTHCTHNAVLVSNAECKQSFLFVYKKALQSPSMEKFVILGNILFCFLAVS